MILRQEQEAWFRLKKMEFNFLKVATYTSYIVVRDSITGFYSGAGGLNVLFVFNLIVFMIFWFVCWMNSR